MRRATVSRHGLPETATVLVTALCLFVDAQAFQNTQILVVDPTNGTSDSSPQAPPKTDPEDNALPSTIDKPATQPATKTDATEPKKVAPEDGVKAPTDDGKQTPQRAETPPGEVMVTVATVKGMVQVREAEDKPWKPARLGMKLPQGAEFRTGPRSQVVIIIPPNQKVALDRLGVIKILQVIRQKGKIKTDIGMEYGRTIYNIEAAGEEHESTIHVPGATLAVRGSTVGITSQGWVQQGFVREGTGAFTPQQGAGVTVQKPHDKAKAQVGDVIAAMDDFAAARLPVPTNRVSDTTFATNVTHIDPAVQNLKFQNNNRMTNSLDPTEKRQQHVNPGLNPGGGMGSDFFGPRRGGVHPPSRPNPDVVSGMLDISLTWSGNADVNLIWTTPNNYSVCPFNNNTVGCTPTSPDGAVASMDSQGPDGIERVLFANRYPPGNHIGTARLFKGTRADFRIDVKRNGTVIDTFSGTLDQQHPQIRDVFNVPVQRAHRQQQPVTLLMLQSITTSFNVPTDSNSP